ncbi:MAG: dihydropteroate synthase [Abditibacteriota bacterium]|nr:dihydropteroate synthase [Abditibacteriota bacterium]
MQLMAILNLTPDSFSDGGLFNTPEKAAERCDHFVRCGAHIIDVGAESTAPGSARVSAAEEMRRLDEVLPSVIASVPLPFSVDTYKAEVAAHALDLGAAYVNDVGGFALSDGMLELIVERRPYYICGHIFGDSLHEDGPGHSPDVIADALRRKADILTEKGFPPERLILDPGFGFGKNIAENVALFKNIDVIRSLGFPVCCGVSRKRLIKHFSGGSPAELLGGSIAACILLAAKDIDIIRAHDVAETAAALRLFDVLGKES